MQFETSLIPGTLLKRYKRFLADVRLEDGKVITAHLANTGSMMGCAEPGIPVALSHHPDKGRKLPYSLELVQVGGAWVCVNTSLPNRIVEEAINAGRIRPLNGYSNLRREVRYGEKSRIDLLLSQGDTDLCYVEIKNVTLRADRGRRALFPDAVTERGTKHLRELMTMVKAGHRAVMVYLVNRTDCTSMAPAAHIDPLYARTLTEAAATGVELLAYRTAIDVEGITIDRKVPVHLQY